MEIEEEPLVKTAATLFQRLCYNYRDQLTAGIICAGWDRKVGAQVMLTCLFACCHQHGFSLLWHLNVHLHHENVCKILCCVALIYSSPVCSTA